MFIRCRVVHLGPGVYSKGIRRPAATLRTYSNLADVYHSKVSVLPFTQDPLAIQSKLDMLIPTMFGFGGAVRGYAQMIFGPNIVSSGIKRLQFKPVYIPTWIVDSVFSFTSYSNDTEQTISAHIREATVPGVHHHPLGAWVKSFPDDIDIAKPFSGEYLEAIGGKHEILALPYTTSPLAIPQALQRLPLGNVEIYDGWSANPRSVDFKMLVAYPLLQPVFLSEFALDDKRITILAHGYHDYFSVWGHPSHPGQWVNSEPSLVVSYLHSLHPANGGPAAIADLVGDITNPSNLEKITHEVNMNDLRIQPISSADTTRDWMQLCAQVTEMKFIINNIPPNAKGRVITIELDKGTGLTKSEVDDDVRTPLERQLKELEEKMEVTKPDWLAKFDESNHNVSNDKVVV